MQEIPYKEQIKLIVCDLDGTLLNDAGVMSDYSKDVLKRCKADDIKICFASGRYSGMMTIFNDEIEGCDYIISNNGALVQKQEHIIHKSIVETVHVKDILKYIFDREMAFAMYSINHIYINRESQIARIEKYEKLAKKHGFDKKLDYSLVKSVEEISDDVEVIKIVLYEDNADKIADYTKFISENNALCSESTGYGLVGTFEANVSKKTALEKVLEDMSIREENVCVFGDYDNDLSMFSVAKYKIAVENANQKLKDEATYITASNNEDGVAKYLEQILKKRNMED